MTPYLPLWGPAALAGVLLALALFVLGAAIEHGPGYVRQFGTVLILSIALAAVGATAGVIGGLSRTSAVGDIVPAILGLIAGVSIYVFGVDRSKGLIASVCVLGFAVSVLVSYVAASGARVEDDQAQATLASCHKGFTDPAILSSDVAMCRFLQIYADDCIRLFDEGRVLTDLERDQYDFTTEQLQFRHFAASITGIQEMLRKMSPTCEVIIAHPNPGANYRKLSRLPNG